MAYSPEDVATALQAANQEFKVQQQRQVERSKRVAARTASFDADTASAREEHETVRGTYNAVQIGLRATPNFFGRHLLPRDLLDSALAREYGEGFHSIATPAVGQTTKSEAITETWRNRVEAGVTIGEATIRALELTDGWRMPRRLGRGYREIRRPGHLTMRATTTEGGVAGHRINIANVSERDMYELRTELRTEFSHEATQFKLLSPVTRANRAYSVASEEMRGRLITNTPAIALAGSILVGLMTDLVPVDIIKQDIRQGLQLDKILEGEPIDFSSLGRKDK